MKKSLFITLLTLFFISLFIVFSTALLDSAEASHTPWSCHIDFFRSPLGCSGNVTDTADSCQTTNISTSCLAGGSLAQVTCVSSPNCGHATSPPTTNQPPIVCNQNGAGLCCPSQWPVACSDNWCCPSGQTCTNNQGCTSNNPCAQFASRGWTQFCPSSNICISPTFDCTTATTCSGQIRVCPSGFRVNCGPPVTCDFIALIPTPTPTSIPKQVNFGIVRFYSILGKIFNDTNRDTKSAGEPNYTGPINIGVSNSFASFAVNNSSGSYSSNNLPPGQYTVTFSGLPQGLVFTYPPSSLIVNLGLPCSFPITSEAGCSSGNIINLNAGVTVNASAWFQAIGLDMRWDSGFTDPLPASKFASILGSGGMPGIIFSGSSTPSFGAGSASQNPFNWMVGNFTNPEVFTDTHNLIPTSYRFLLETAQSSGITPANIATLDSSLTHGIYKVNGDLNLNGSSYSFGPGNFIILIDGNLNINEKILVPIGSTVIFSAKGNITVNRAIGEIASSTTPTLEGLYSADGNFVADGNKNCSLAPDLRLNVAGSIIANADRRGGTFVNRRDLCAGNSTFPSVSFIERPDFMLNYPTLVKQTTRAWQEAAP